MPHLLIHQLLLASKLLETAHADGDLAWRAGLIGIARDTYLYTVELLGRTPVLAPRERSLVDERMEEFQTSIARLETTFREQLAMQIA